MTRRWPLILLALPAGVATWSGWVGLGELSGFGVVKPLPGISEWEINTAITLPIGVEAYAAYALGAWLSGRPLDTSTRSFAKWSAIGSLLLGMLGQVAYHLLAVSGVASAPWQVVTVVSCLPVAVLGMGAALGHMLARGGTNLHENLREVEAPTEGDSPAIYAPETPSNLRGFPDPPEGVPDVPGYVPEPLPEELATRAASAFLADVVTGQVPGVKRIKAELGIGQEKAQQVRTYLEALAAS